MKAPESPQTWTGVELSVVVTFPTWPALFLPQHRTGPPFVSTQVWESPAAIVVTPLESP